MTRNKLFTTVGVGVLGLGVATVAVLLAGAWRQQQEGQAIPHSQTAQGPGQGAAAPAQQEPGRQHGTPEAWKFTLPKGGDPVKGRAAFVKFECYTCHEVKGENFAAPDPGKVGPELSAMADAHPPEYFAEAVINPNAVIDRGRGYEAPDGSSKMPSFNEDMTVQELIDLMAYLTTLKPSAPAAAPSGAAPPAGGHGPRGH